MFEIAGGILLAIAILCGVIFAGMVMQLIFLNLWWMLEPFRRSIYGLLHWKFLLSDEECSYEDYVARHRYDHLA